MADPTPTPVAPDDPSNLGFWDRMAYTFKGGNIPMEPPQAPVQAPGPGNYIKLSDGSFLQVPQGATKEAVQSAAQQAEGVIDAQYRKQAADTNAPVYPGGSKVYSASHTYDGDTGITRAMAWADHNLGGNWMNRNIADPLNAATTVPKSVPGIGGMEAGPAAMRVGTTAFTGVPDFLVTGANVARHMAGVEGPDLPAPGPDIRAAMGFPEVSADASFAQRALEAALTHRVASGGFSVPSGGDVARSAILGTTGTGLGDIGQAAFGEAGGFAGSLFGGGGLPIRRGIIDLVARTAARDAPQLYRDTQLLGYDPSYRMLAHPGGFGQRVGNALASVPVPLNALARANEGVSEGIRNARDTLAQDINQGRPLTPDDSIGGSLTVGARQAIPRVQNQMDALYANVPRFSTVDIQPIVHAMEQELSRNPVSTPQENAIRATVQRMADWAPGGNRFIGPMPANQPPPGTPGSPMPVPTNVVRSERSQLKRSLGPGDVRAPDDWIQRIKDWQTDAMRAAAEQADPGRGGAAYDMARTNYAIQKNNVLDRLYRMAGRPVGRNTGRFEENPPEAQVAKQLTGNLLSPNALEMLANPNTFDPRYWREAVAQQIQRLGQTSKGDYRPEGVGEGLSPEKVHPQSLDLMMDPAQRQRAEALQRTAMRYSTPQSRHGLLNTIGSAAALHKILTAAGAGAGWLAGGGPVGAAAGGLVPSGLVIGLSHLFEHPAVKRAMAGLPSNLPSYFDAIPNVAANVTQQQAQHPQGEVVR